MMRKTKHDLSILLCCIVYLTSTAFSCQICENDPDLFDASAKLAIPGQFQALVSNCGSLQTLLPVIITMANIECASIQGIAGPLCGCPVEHDDEGESCRLCGNTNTSIPESFISKSITVYPDEAILLSPDFILLMENGINPSCQLLDGYAQSMSSKNETCDILMDMFGDRCGCFEQNNVTSIVNIINTTKHPPPRAMETSFCPVCNTEKDMENFTPNVRIGILKELLQYPEALTCEEALPISRSFPEESENCKMFNLFSYLCGCNDGVRLFLGADTKAKQAVLVWMPRFTGLFSLIGSLFIIFDVTKSNGKKLRKSMMHQLVAGMSVFDVITSMSLMLATLPVPKTQFGSDTAIYGAMGNEQTCTAQGFFLQLGYTGVFYNMLLSTYYLCVIKFNVSETRLLQKKYWFHIPVLVVGLGLAFAGIPFYDNALLYCHIPPPIVNMVNGVATYITKTKNGIPVIVFSAIPIGIGIAVGSTNMLIIYLAVRKQEKTAKKWKISKYTEGSSGISNNTKGNSGISNNPEESSSINIVTNRTSLHSSIFIKLKTRYNSYKTKRAARRSRNQSPMANSVFKQAVFYWGSFLLCWPIFYAINFSEKLQKGGTESYTIMVCLVTLVPLQGFFNALVYFRKRIIKYFKNLREKRKEKKMAKKEGKEIISTRGAKSSSKTLLESQFTVEPIIEEKEKEKGGKDAVGIPITSSNTPLDFQLSNVDLSSTPIKTKRELKELRSWMKSVKYFGDNKQN